MSKARMLQRVLIIAAVGLPCPTQGEGLLELYDQTFETNPALRGRVFGIEQARAQKDLARSKLLPQVMADGIYDWNKYNEEGLAPDRYSGVRGVVSARQLIFDLSTYHRYRSAKVVVEQSELEFSAMEMEIASELIDRYLTVLQAEDEIKYLQSDKAATENQLKRLRFMRERKLAKMTDLYEVEAYYQGLITREIESTNARAVALARLRETTGVAVNEVSALARDVLPAVPGDAERWTLDAVATNPALQSLERAAEAARRLVDSSRAEYLPRLAVASSKVYADQGYDNREVEPYQVGTVGIELSMPIYEGGRVQAGVREARARHSIAREQFEAARREVESNAREAYLNAVASHARSRSTAAETRAMEKVVEAQERSYEIQATTVLDVLVARRRLTKARTEESKARYDYVRDLSTLHAQIGQLNRAHVAQVDGWLVGRMP